MRPARFEEVARQERSAYRSLLVPLHELRQKMFRLLRLEDQKALWLRRKFEWDAYTQVQWDRAIREFLVETQGSADIRAAATDWHFSEAALPTEWRLGTRIGIDRATLITGAEEAATREVNERFMRAFGDHAFERLSDGGRSRLGLMLDGPDVPGGSIRSIIEGAVSSGENPLTTARALSERFDQYERWEFTRLTRTEVAFAQEAGIREELRGEGFQEIAGVDYPPYHPNCCCSTTVDMETGLILPSVSPSACELCQAALLNALVLSETAPERVALVVSIEPPSFGTAAEAEDWFNGQGVSISNTLPEAAVDQAARLQYEAKPLSASELQTAAQAWAQAVNVLNPVAIEMLKGDGLMFFGMKGGDLAGTSIVPAPGQAGPVGINLRNARNLKPRDFVDTSPEGVVRHELMHRLQYAGGHDIFIEENAWAMMRSPGAWSPSPYSSSAGNEWFAEFLTKITKPGFSLDDLPSEWRALARRFLR